MSVIARASRADCVRDVRLPLCGYQRGEPLRRSPRNPTFGVRPCDGSSLPPPRWYRQSEKRTSRICRNAPALMESQERSYTPPRLPGWEFVAFHQYAQYHSACGRGTREQRKSCRPFGRDDVPLRRGKRKRRGENRTCAKPRGGLSIRWRISPRPKSGIARFWSGNRLGYVAFHRILGRQGPFVIQFRERHSPGVNAVPL